MPYNTNKKDNVTVIGSDAFIEGDIETQESIFIDGYVKSENIIALEVILGINAKIEGNIKAAHIRIDGEVKGNLEAEESLTLCSNARVEGSVYSPSLKIEHGAVLEGSCNLFGEDFTEVLLDK